MASSDTAIKTTQKHIKTRTHGDKVRDTTGNQEKSIMPYPKTTLTSPCRSSLRDRLPTAVPTRCTGGTRTLEVTFYKRNAGEHEGNDRRLTFHIELPSDGHLPLSSRSCNPSQLGIPIKCLRICLPYRR